MPKADDERWLAGRTRNVRVVLTEEEHAIVRQAAALADRSVSRFSVESIVEAARRRVGKAEPGTSAEQTEPAAKGKGRGKKKD